jgi:ABC-2 type transport system permease protein
MTPRPHAAAPSGTFAPRPGAAPFPRQVAAQTRMETLLLLRNGEQLLLALVIPLIVLVGGALAAGRVGLDFPAGTVATLTPGVLALAVMSTAFTSLAISTGFERRYGVLKRLGASPGVAGFAGAVLTVLLGTAAFASLGLALAGALRAEATLAAANLVYLLLMAGGAVVIPSSSYGAVAPLIGLLPSGALGDGLRTALIDGAVPVGPLLVLVAWAALGTALTSRTFKWE